MNYIRKHKKAALLIAVVVVVLFAFVDLAAEAYHVQIRIR